MSGLAFADPVFDAQAAFRAALKAMSQPGQIVACGRALTPPASLAPAAAAVLLALADFETPLWVAPDFPQRAECLEYLRFHTGAPRAEAPQKSAFALLRLSEAPLDLAAFASGKLTYPDASTTLVLQAETLSDNGALILSGPGVNGEARLELTPRPGNFVAALAANSQSFPLGVDMFIAAGATLAALARSTHVRETR